MKPRRPVVIAHQPHAEALDVLQWHARQLDCSVVRPQELVKLEPRGMEHAAEGVLQKVQAVPHGMPWFQETGKLSACQNFVCSGFSNIALLCCSTSGHAYVTPAESGLEAELNSSNYGD